MQESGHKQELFKKAKKSSVDAKHHKLTLIPSTASTSTIKGGPSPGKVKHELISPVASRTLTGKMNFAMPGGIDLNKAKITEEASLYKTKANILAAHAAQEKQQNQGSIIDVDGNDPVASYEAEIKRERERYEQ